MLLNICYHPALHRIAVFVNSSSHTVSAQAELLVADASTTLTISGNGDVLEPHDGVMGGCRGAAAGAGAGAGLAVCRCAAGHGRQLCVRAVRMSCAGGACVRACICPRCYELGRSV